MKDKEDKELIKHIADKLREHEAPYKEGAWEKFASSSKSAKKLVLWPYLSGAAMLLLSAVLFLFKAPDHPAVGKIKAKLAEKTDQSFQPEMSEIPKKQEPGTAVPTPGVESIVSRLPIPPPGHKAAAGSAYVGNTPKSPEHHEQPVSETQVAETTEHNPETTKSSPAKAEEHKDRFLEMLKRDSKNAVAEHSEKVTDKKWGLGVILAPSATRDRFNFGGGVEVAYHINQRLSIGTGVSMTGLGIQQPGNNSYTTQAISNSKNAIPSTSLSSGIKLTNAEASQQSGQLKSIRTSVVGVDIPLNFKYHFTPSFYASAGASFFAIVRETRANIYVKQVSTTQTISGDNGLAAVQPVIETKQTTVNTSEQPLSNNNFNGFLNFSVGHRIPLSSKIQVGLEPFVKFPLGRVAKQDVNLSYGGIKLTVGF